MKNVVKDNFAFLEIAGISVENPRVKNFRFEAALRAEPGQFVMLWIPGVDAKPFGVMNQDKNGFEVTVAELGPFTKKLFALKRGDCVGIQGAFGKPFVIPSKAKKVALVAGGFGAAPLAFLAQRLKEKKIDVIFIEGAKTKSGDCVRSAAISALRRMTAARVSRVTALPCWRRRYVRKKSIAFSLAVPNA